MTQVLRSKICGPQRAEFDSPPSSLCQNDDDDGRYDSEEDENFMNPMSPFIISGSEAVSDGGGSEGPAGRKEERYREQFPVLAILVAALRKSLVTCGVDREEICSMDISWPTNVRHIAHVTFDRFNGFLGLPDEFEPEIPRRVPSASVSVFGVSAESMQCAIDHRGNSVPIILLLMQRCLYSQGGLRAEGIFRINAENGQEEYVRDELNKGIVPHGIDLHCLAGLIKAWFRELPTGVLDSLTPEQVMHCNTEEECADLVRKLPPTEAALLDWAINLMADVVQHEHYNKMNARNIAMVFAPNMTQMADPLTALIHAVQVMNFLKTLIIKMLREREESAADARVLSACLESPNNNDRHSSSNFVAITGESNEKIAYNCLHDEPADSDKLFRSIEGGLGSDADESFESFQEKSEEADEDGEHISRQSSVSLVKCRGVNTVENGDFEGLLDRLSLRKGVWKLCRHPVFQLSRPVKKSQGLGIVNSRVERGEEACA